MENITFSTTVGKMDWLRTISQKTNRSVDYLINLLIDGYLEDVEFAYDSMKNENSIRG